MKLVAQFVILVALFQGIASFAPQSAVVKTARQLHTPTGVLPLPTNSWMATSMQTTRQQQQQQQRQQLGRQSVATVQMKGLFGLGLGEVVVILVVVGFVLGPQNIGRLVRTGADRASALKDELERVPEEFKKGIEEGEDNVRSRKARVIKVVKDEEEE